jgi:hypothetical protein
VRPGHPDPELEINFQDSEEASQVAFFGLPGNPMACAACLRFFVISYLRFLHGSLPERRIPCRIWSGERPSTSTDLPMTSRELLSPTSHLDIFRLAIRSQDCGCPCVRPVPRRGARIRSNHCFKLIAGSYSRATEPSSKGELYSIRCRCTQRHLELSE